MRNTKKVEGYKLRAKRKKSTVEMYGFPLVIRTKPTAHKQYCLVCRNEINKGEKQITLPYGMWAISSYDAHATAVYDKINGKSGNRFYTRYIYLHPDCFGCLINKMMLKADLPHLQTGLVCDNCKNRFNCWTGNMDDNNLPLYSPARPCGSDGFRCEDSC